MNSQKNFTRHSLITRLTALTLLAALFVPMFGGALPVSAHQDRKPVAPAPEAAPPEPFMVYSPSSTASIITGTYGTVSSVAAGILALIKGPRIPEGLEQPETVPSAVAPEPSAPAPPTPPAMVNYDFDGDGMADFSRRHPSTAEWKIKNSSTGNYTTATVGSGSATLAPGDFDGDGKTDAAVFSSGTWTIRKSSNGQTQTVSFGTSGDKPVVGDYDDDDVSDIAVFRPSTNTWWIQQSSNNQTVSNTFGAAGDVTAQGDFDGDGKTDICVFRPSTGDWHVSGSSSGYFAFHWGIASDIPVPADYDGDSVTDFAVYRGSTGVWYAAKSSDSNNSYYTQYWGMYGDQPVPADYDGDGKADFAVWRPTNGVWYVVKSGTANSYIYETLGVAGDTAVPSAYLKQIGGYIYSYDFAKVRLSPKNATGGTDLYSRNFGWSAPLFSLPGRAGLDAGLGISYNSLVWTKDPATDTIVFNADNSNVTPGFRFGFPTIEPVYYDASTQKFAYMMVTPSGARVEFRQTTNSNIFETADSSYAQLKINGSAGPNDPADSFTVNVTGTDGTSANYAWINGAYRCVKITDRNGNYITVTHDGDGLLTKVTDTLGREVNVSYNNDGFPSSVTQTWKNDNGAGSDVTRTYATFSYSTKEINTNFSGLTVIGPGNGYQLKVLDKITFPTESNGAGPSVSFTYNSYGQVTKITNKAADGHQLNYTSVNLPADATTAQTDCPRFTETRGWVENFNLNSSGVAQEAVVTNTLTENASYNVGSLSGTATKIEVALSGHPNEAFARTFVGSTGWMEGLTIATDDWADGTGGSERKRWTTNVWTQDDVNASYILNPRVTDSAVGDTGSVKKSKSYYVPVSQNSPVALWGLVWKAEVLDQNDTVLKRAETDYNLTSAYTDRRIIGLPSEVRTYGIENNSLTLATRTGYTYDEGDFSDTNLEQDISSVIMHDTANYGASVSVGRGNMTTATRFDVTGTTSAVSSQIKYNIAGAPVAQISPWTTTSTRTTKIGYSDAFNDTSTSRNTYAYPTKLYDPAGNYSEVKYRFDTGANVWARSPAPAGNTTGKETTREFDAVGRILKNTVVNTGAYMRFVYPTNNIQSQVFSTIVDTDNDGADADDEVMSEAWTDGAGRVRRSRTEHPGSTGGWSATLTEYDVLGQIKRTTVPTEVSVPNINNPETWSRAGDDATRAWLWTQAEYDWKGRITRQVNTDGTDRLATYEGCGCAGGDVITEQSEAVPRSDQTGSNAGRTKKTYHDILGRSYLTESLNWDGSVYSSTTLEFNSADQPTRIRQYQGSITGSVFQEMTRTYDGYGRTVTEHYPKQEANKNTTYEYTLDDQLQSITDARGATKSFVYDDETGLLAQISFAAPPVSETNHPKITESGRGANGDSIWIHGSNFDNDVTIVVATREYGTGHFVELGRFSGSQISTGTTGNGQQSLSFQVSPQIVQALDAASVFVWVENGSTTRFSNQAYQAYDGSWRVVAPFDQAQLQTPSSISFEYDALGNRTLMTDGMGTVTYQYDQLSRLTSESRHFFGSQVGNDLQSAPGGPGIFNLAYDYDFGGNLKTITDPYGQSVDYTRNKIGRTLSVSGSAFAGGTHSYASNTKYRAWGAVKSVDYVNNGGTTTESYAYNSRLMPDKYTLYHASLGLASIQKQYQYYADGNPSYVRDGNPEGPGTMFDRSFRYDQIGRLVESRTGAEARGGETPPVNERPYSFERSYDVWGNATSTERSYWGSAYLDEPLFINNRVVGYNAALSATHYDSDGREIWADYIVYGIDAAGDQTYVESINLYKQNRWMDGESHLVREHITDFVVDQSFPDGHYVLRPEVKYFIRSSLFGGDVISETRKDGSKAVSYVYGMSKVLGRQILTQNPSNQTISWEYVDSSGTSRGGSNQFQSNPTPFDRSELDPIGVDAGTEPPDSNGGGNWEPWEYPRLSDPYEGDQGCTVDGVQISCSVVSGLLGNGSAVQCPDNDCGPRSHYDPVTGAGQLLYLNTVALAMGIGTTGYGPGFLPKNVGFNGSTFSVSGVASFRTGYSRAGFVHNEDISVDELDIASDGLWSATLARFQASTQQTQQVISENMRRFQAAVQGAQQVLQDPACGALFGGLGRGALDYLAGSVNDSSFVDLGSAATGIRMTVTVRMERTALPPQIINPDGTTGYGILDATSININTRGAFVRQLPVSNSSTDALPHYGNYSPGSIQSRVLQLLHEVGHLIMTGHIPIRTVIQVNNQNRTYLRQQAVQLFGPDQGNANASTGYTNRVLAACGNAIGALQ